MRDARETQVIDATMRMLEKVLETTDGTPTPRLAYLWVTAVNKSRLDPRENLSAISPAIHTAIEMLASLTPKQLLTTFPPEKRYDGSRWELKDYFSTMEAVAEHHQDKPIGMKDILDLLWDYENREIRKFLVMVCGMTSEYARREGRKDAFDLFFMSPRYTSKNGAQFASDADGTPVMVRGPRLYLATNDQ